MQFPIRRRTFLKSAAVSLATPGVFGLRAGAAPSDQITLGFIGTGGHGVGWNLSAFLKIPEVRAVAVCDVFRNRREHARGIVNNAYGNQDCQAYNDFREILARDDIDAVVISTPDHWHVLMSILAAKAGKHVFCEKPTLTVEEGQVLIDVMNQTGVVYQGGIEDRSIDIYHRMAELVRNGRLGDLKRIRIALPPGKVFPREEPVPVPDGLDYDLWLGPAPFSPYSPSKLDQQAWRNQFAYSGGKLTDWGAHLIDTAQVALDVTHGGPIEVDGKGDFPIDALSDTATTYEVRYVYRSGVEMIVKSDGTGIGFEGSEGWIKSPAWQKPIEASDPAILGAEFSPDDNKLYPLPKNEHQAFVDGIRRGKTPYYKPTDIHRLSSVMHIANISMRLGRKLQWDPDAERFPEDDAANAMLRRAMRAPWSLTDSAQTPPSDGDRAV